MKLFRSGKLAISSASLGRGNKDPISGNILSVLLFVLCISCFSQFLINFLPSFSFSFFPFFFNISRQKPVWPCLRPPILKYYFLRYHVTHRCMICGTGNACPLINRSTPFPSWQPSLSRSWFWPLPVLVIELAVVDGTLVDCPNSKLTVSAPICKGAILRGPSSSPLYHCSVSISSPRPSTAMSFSISLASGVIPWWPLNIQCSSFHFTII